MEAEVVVEEEMANVGGALMTNAGVVIDEGVTMNANTANGKEVEAGTLIEEVVTPRMCAKVSKMVITAEGREAEVATIRRSRTILEQLSGESGCRPLQALKNWNPHSGDLSFFFLSIFDGGSNIPPCSLYPSLLCV
jgi:hypothetical protein